MKTVRLIDSSKYVCVCATLAGMSSFHFAKLIEKHTRVLFIPHSHNEYSQREMKLMKFICNCNEQRQGECCLLPMAKKNNQQHWCYLFFFFFLVLFRKLITQFLKYFWVFFCAALEFYVSSGCLIKNANEIIWNMLNEKAFHWRNAPQTEHIKEEKKNNHMKIKT